MSTVSDELERIALSRNDQSERDELLKLYPTVLLMESERAAVGRLTNRVKELETKAADLQSQRQIEHWSLEQAYENVKKLSLQLNAAEDRVKFTSVASDGVCQVYANRINELETKAAEVVSELRKPTCHHANPYGCGWDEGRYAVADLITKKLGLK